MAKPIEATDRLAELLLRTHGFRTYVAEHPFGGKPPKPGQPVGVAKGGGMPARPYFPFDACGNLMSAEAGLMMATVRRRFQGMLEGKV